MIDKIYIVEYLGKNQSGHVEKKTFVARRFQDTCFDERPLQESETMIFAISVHPLAVVEQ